MDALATLCISQAPGEVIAIGAQLNHRTNIPKVEHTVPANHSNAPEISLGEIPGLAYGERWGSEPSTILWQQRTPSPPHLPYQDTVDTAYMKRSLSYSKRESFRGLVSLYGGFLYTGVV